MSNTTAPRERRPSTGAPIDLQGPVGPGFTRPKHKRTFTGFGAGEIKNVEGKSIRSVLSFLQLFPLICVPMITEPLVNGVLPQQLLSPNLNARPGRNTLPKASEQLRTSREVVRHVETTLARSMFNCDETAAYAAASLAFRDRLITEWNRTQQRQTFADGKRIYYLSLEFLMGRALDNAMLNVGMKEIAKGGASLLPFRLAAIC